VRLTRYTQGLGCACKMRPQELEAVLRSFPPSVDPRVLVGIATADDAAVYRLGDDLAIVQTVDFFTPICDDPFDFGAISAANSLSDVYAMGASPRFALSVVGFPTKRLDLAVLERILAGAAEVAREAGIEIVGGHSVEDPEPKFGLVVTGTVHPDEVLANAGAASGDVLFLTKPIGTGILATAAKRDLAAPEHVAAGIEVMRRLNRGAAEALHGTEGVHACTDVTGFGLLGHLRELAVASGVDVALDVDRVPVLDGVRDLAAADVAPGGSLDNLAHVSPHVTWCEDQSRADKVVLADAQTSGGLLVAVAAEHAEALGGRFAERGVPAVRVGEVTGPGPGRIVCRRG
jgi:selenide,water dikinase